MGAAVTPSRHASNTRHAVLRRRPRTVIHCYTRPITYFLQARRPRLLNTNIYVEQIPDPEDSMAVTSLAAAAAAETMLRERCVLRDFHVAVTKASPRVTC